MENDNRNNVVKSNDNANCDVSLANKTNLKRNMRQTDTAGKYVSGTASLTVPDTSAKCLRILFWCLLTVLTVLVLLFSYKVNVNAAESDVYVEDTYMTENFGQYKYYAIVTDGAGNYATIYSDGQIISTGTTIHSLLTNGYYGFNTMKIEDDYLVIDENGKSYNTWSSVTVQLNSLNIGYTSSINQIIWSNVDIYQTVFSNTGSPSASDKVIHSVANNIGSKPVDEPTEPTPTPDIIVDCGFTDENILERLDTIETNTMEKMETINSTMVAKMDILITLILVMIAIRMFSPLANNHKRGLQKKEK